MVISGLEISWHTQKSYFAVNYRVYQFSLNPARLMWHPKWLFEWVSKQALSISSYVIFSIVWLSISNFIFIYQVQSSNSKAVNICCKLSVILSCYTRTCMQRRWTIICLCLFYILWDKQKTNWSVTICHTFNIPKLQRNTYMYEFFV